MKVSSVDKLSGLIGAGLAVTMFWYAGTFPERAAAAALYIKFLAVVLLVFSILIVLRAFYTKDGKGIKWLERPVYFYITTGFLIVYVVLLSILGFFISSFLFMFALSWLLGYRKIVSLSVGTVSLLLVIYFVFERFLSVPVPSGVLGIF